VKIKKITYRNRRDFTAVFQCQHCGHEYKGEGYDDAYYHNHVIPAIVCKKCDKSGGDYVPLTPKYREGFQI